MKAWKRAKQLIGTVKVIEHIKDHAPQHLHTFINYAIEEGKRGR